VKRFGSIVKKVERPYRFFCNLEVVVCSVLFVSVVALVFLSALLRKISFPIQWSIDVSQLFFAWMAFLGGDIALRKGSLVGVGLLTQKFSEKVQRILKMFCYGFMLVLLLIFIKYGFSLAARNWNRAFQTLPISYSLVTLSLPVSAICMIFSIVHNIHLDLTKPAEKEGLTCGCC